MNIWEFLDRNILGVIVLAFLVFCCVLAVVTA